MQRQSVRTKTNNASSLLRAGTSSDFFFCAGAPVYRSNNVSGTAPHGGDSTHLPTAASPPAITSTLSTRRLCCGRSVDGRGVGVVAAHTVPVVHAVMLER